MAARNPHRTRRGGYQPPAIRTKPVGAAISRPRVDEDIDPYAPHP